MESIDSFSSDTGNRHHLARTQGMSSELGLVGWPWKLSLKQLKLDAEEQSSKGKQNGGLSAFLSHFYDCTVTMAASDSPALMENMHSVWINSQVDNIPWLQGCVLRSTECQYLITKTDVYILL